MRLSELTRFLDEELNLDAFSSDHSNNGLQVQGRSEVRTVAAGVDASLALFDAARDAGADLILVHHGLSWGAEPRRFTGVAGTRLNALFSRGMSLYAAHLPLDAHGTYGNNARLAAVGNLKNLRRCCRCCGVDVGFRGELPEPAGAEEFAAVYERRLSCRARVFGRPGRMIKSVYVVSGCAGCDALQDAADCGCDAVLTGEFTHIMHHVAAELNLPVIALGHYASETVGVRALLDVVAAKFRLTTRFIDLPTGL